MSRIVPFDRSATCDSCSAIGAFDFMGDYLCAECARLVVEHDDTDDETAEAGELDEEAPAA